MTRYETKIKAIIAKLEKQQRTLRQVLGDLREIDGSAPERLGRIISFDDHERGLIASAMTRSQGNQSKAARMLGISRDRLRYKIVKYKLR